jgi:hypothetical protein
VEQASIPASEPGQVVVMDNAAFPRLQRTRESIEAAGYILLYLPTYSPDSNPIEKFWANSKRKLANVLHLFFPLEDALGHVFVCLSQWRQLYLRTQNIVQEIDEDLECYGEHFNASVLSFVNPCDSRILCNRRFFTAIMAVYYVNNMHAVAGRGIASTTAHYTEDDKVREFIQLAITNDNVRQIFSMFDTLGHFDGELPDQPGTGSGS